MEREIFYANRDGTDGMLKKNIHLSSDYELIAEFFGDRKNQLKEARLLRAAPALLEACKQAWDYVHAYKRPGDFTRDDMSCTLNIVENVLTVAIAKAEGE